jgi:hypothetical protein
MSSKEGPLKMAALKIFPKEPKKEEKESITIPSG